MYHRDRETKRQTNGGKEYTVRDTETERQRDLETERLRDR